MASEGSRAVGLDGPASGPKPQTPARAIERARARVGRAQARGSIELTAARDAHRREQDALVERARSRSSSAGPPGAEILRRLVESVIARAALDAAEVALEEARPIVLAADGARIRALAGLAASAGKSARARIEKEIASIAKRGTDTDIDDTDAWVRAARAAKGRAREHFAMAAVATAGRSQSARAHVAALDVAPEPAAGHLARAAAGSLAASFAAMELGVIPHDASVVATTCELLTPDGARHLVRALAEDPSPPLRGAALLDARARARLLARALPLLPETERRAAASVVMKLIRGDNYDWLDEEEDATFLRHLDGPDLERALCESQHPAAVAPRLAMLGRTEAARALLESAGGDWYTARPALKAAFFAPERLGELARSSLAALDAPGQGRLCGELAAEAVRVLGPSEVLRIADASGDDAGQYVRIVALARVAEALPEPQRSEAAERAARAYHEDPDFDALCELLRCARWMPRHEAAWLLFESLGRHTAAEPFDQVFIGYAGVGRLAPLIARAAGDPGVAAASEAILAAGDLA